MTASSWRWTELRIHGVSGTPAEVLVGSAVVDEVAGDEFVRFVRSSGQRPSQTTPAVAVELEGMSWGRLTSGPARQAAWLLLIPFGLLNLAFWATTVQGSGWSAAAFRGIIRVLSLTVTVVFVLAVVHVAVDLVAWQCRDGEACRVVGDATAFASGWTAGQRVAGAMLVPVAVIAALAWLSHRASLRYEGVTSPDLADGEAPSTQQPALDSGLMWRGEALVSRLRSIHLAVGWATTALVVAQLPSAHPGIAVTATALAIIVVVGGVAMLVWPWRWTAWTDVPVGGQRAVSLLFQCAALSSVVLAGVAALVGRALATGNGALPGLAGSVAVVVAAQTLLLLLLAAHLAFAREPRTKRRVAAWGFGSLLLAASGVLLGYAYSAGVSLRLAALLRGDADNGQGDVATLSTLEIFEWGAAGFAVFGALVFVVGLCVFTWVSRTSRRSVGSVLEDYLPMVRAAGASTKLPSAVYRRWREDHRIRRIVRPRRISEVTQADRVLRFLAVAAAIGIAIAVAAVVDSVLHLTGGGGSPPAWLVQGGSWAMIAAAGGLVALVVAGWRSETWRRRLGIAWDVMSFWPRAAHPLAPPSYTERAVPQLVARTRHLAGPGPSSPHPSGVVLSGHSQGSVIAVAVVMQIHALDAVAGLDRVALLTYGSPLGRVYEYVFPQYFGEQQLREVWTRLDRRWINLYRATDPIGSSIKEVLNGNDRLCPDPSAYDMDPERAAYPPVRGHSGYTDDACFAPALHELIVQLASRPRW